MSGSYASTAARRRGRPIALAIIFALPLGACPAVAHADPPLQPGPRVAPVAAPPVDEPTPITAYVIGALGLSGISVAGVTGFLAMNQQGIVEDHCSPTLRLCDGAGRQANETGRTLRDISTAAWIVGGIGVGLSAYLLLTAPSRQNQVALSVSVDGANPKAAFVARF